MELVANTLLVRWLRGVISYCGGEEEKGRLRVFFGLCLQSA